MTRLRPHPDWMLDDLVDGVPTTFPLLEAGAGACLALIADERADAG